VSSAIAEDNGPLIVSPYVLAELDYHLLDRWGVRSELAALAELQSGAWKLAQFDAADLRMAYSIIERYRDQEIGLTDASLVVLADRYRTDRILTLDHRHFNVLRTADGAPFKLLPE